MKYIKTTFGEIEVGQEFVSTCCNEYIKVNAHRAKKTGIAWQYSDHTWEFSPIKEVRVKA